MISTVTLALVLCVELAAFLWLSAEGSDVYPFLYAVSTNNDTPDEGEELTRFNRHVSYIDPHLGYAHDIGAINRLTWISGFAIHGEHASTDSDEVIRIVTLGGSTTDPQSTGNWSQALHEIFHVAGVEAQVLNGGVSGYSSNQELIKLIRDVLPLNPDIVISFNGINDVGFMHSLDRHPMVHKYQHQVMNSIVGGAEVPPVMPNTYTLLSRTLSRLAESDSYVTGVSYGTGVEVTPVEQWHRNVRTMRAVATEFDVEYLVFLQPTMGIGTYTPTVEAEKEMLSSIEGSRYAHQLAAFYKGAREICIELPYCTDLTNVFAGETGEAYADVRHPNEAGYRLIAWTMARDLVRRYAHETRFESLASLPMQELTGRTVSTGLDGKNVDK